MVLMKCAFNQLCARTYIWIIKLERTRVMSIRPNDKSHVPIPQNTCALDSNSKSKLC